MMNLYELSTIQEVDKLLGQALEGKIENLPQVKKAKELVSQMIEFKDFDNVEAWKLAQD